MRCCSSNCRFRNRLGSQHRVFTSSQAAPISPGHSLRRSSSRAQLLIMAGINLGLPQVSLPEQLLLSTQPQVPLPIIIYVTQSGAVDVGSHPLEVPISHPQVLENTSTLLPSNPRLLVTSSTQISGDVQSSSAEQPHVPAVGKGSASQISIVGDNVALVSVTRLMVTCRRVSVLGNQYGSGLCGLSSARPDKCCW